MIRSIAIVVLILFSCTHKSIRSKIGDADRIEVVDLESKFSHTDTMKEVVMGFKEVLDGKPEPTDCEPQGNVLFKKGDNTRLQVGYYKDASACAFLIVDNGGEKTGYRLSHNVLAYLGVYFQQLKKQHDVRNH